MLKNYLCKFLTFAVFLMATSFLLAQAPVTVQITAPASIAGDYNGIEAAFGPLAGDAIAGPMMFSDDGTGITDGCSPIANDLTGMIALIDRGACSFVQKAINAQDAGAMAVVVCNDDTDNPDNVITLGGDDGCALGIPTVMLSYNDCQTIRVETGIMGGIIGTTPPAGEDFTTAIVIDTGTTHIDTITGTGTTIDADASAGAWFSFTPPNDGLADVNSCFGGVDTRLAVFTGCRGSGLTLIDMNDDFCDLGDGNEWASELTGLVAGGTEYLIVFDDRWDASGFDFHVSLDASPVINVTFNVDMAAETVDPGGVLITGSFNGWTQEAMTDNGDGTWSFTASITASAEGGVQYKFLNGPDGFEPSGDLAACGVDDGFGGFNRTADLNSLEDVDLPLVCFASCDGCFDTFVDVTAPASIAGRYEANQAAFGPLAGDQLSGDLMMADDGSGVTDGCDSIANDLTGKVALIDRGACSFVQKVTNAQAAGAIAVVICNNDTDAPDNVFIMGGNDGCTLDIPALMISYNSCQTIRAELGGGVSGNLISPAVLPTEDVSTAVQIDTGTTTITAITGTHAVLQDATGAAWFTYTPPNDGVLNANSCFGGVDTRMAIITGCRNELVLVGANDDACDLGDGNEWASDLTIVARAGTDYHIYWDDRWDAAGFDFNLSLGELPPINLTFTVDMSQETVDPGGALIAGSFNGWTQVPMTDNGDGTWSFTAVITAGDQVQWKYLNGPDGWEASGDLAACGIDDGFGGFNRFEEINEVNDVSLPVVCFTSCDACPPPGCTDPTAIICQDFEGFTLGDDIGPQSANWIPWGLVDGAGDDAVISDAQAFSGTQSIEISEAGGDDLLLRLGDSTSGNYLLDWYMYVPAGNQGYYNIQKIQDNPGGEFGMEIFFNDGGSGTMNAGSVGATTFSFLQDTWMHIQHFIDLDNDIITLAIDGVEVFSWPFSYRASATTGGTIQLGAIDFFGNTNNLYYVDDVFFRRLPPAPAGNVCGTANDVSGLFGQGVGNVVNSGLVDNTNAMTIPSDPADGWDCYGEPDGSGSAPSLENTLWFSFMGDGETYRIETQQCGASDADYVTNGDTQMSIYSGTCDALTPVACNEDSDNAADPNYFSGFTAFQTEVGVEYWVMVDGFNFNGALSVGQFCLEVEQITATAVAETEFEKGLLMHPNPASDLTILSYNFSESTDLNIRLSNNLGQTIFARNLPGAQSGDEELKLNGLANGLYFVVISDEENVVTKRLVIAH